MTSPHQNQIRAEIAAAMTALSHPRRVAIFDALEAAGGRGLGLETLLRETRFSLATLRHHLARMEAAGLVIRQRQGVAVHFRLTSAPVLGVAASLVTRLSSLEAPRAI